MSSRLKSVALSLCLSTCLPSVLAASSGSFVQAGDSLVSALMMFLGNDEHVYILDKAEGNPARVAGHPAWGSRWNFLSHESTVMDIKTNSFCASGMHLPDGSFATFGGNDAVGLGGVAGSQKHPDGTGSWDSVYMDFDGRRAIRILKPCHSTDDLDSTACNWSDEPEGTGISMKKRRWYSAAEPLGDGTIIIVGGFVNGGYINRWYPIQDPITQSGQAENTYEYYPARAGDPPIFDFLTRTGGLNAYAHTYLMPSGKILVQANVSTILWDHDANTETQLPDMLNGVVRVYPASGATAMLPLTPDNNYTPTMLFCGGAVIPDEGWGDYAGPKFDTWNIPASTDCQRLTPERTDSAPVAYEQMTTCQKGAQWAIYFSPDGKMLVINGALNGTAGYSLGTPNTPRAQMPYGVSLASGPVLTPAIYDPKAAKGKRWSTAGLGSSTIPRVYHSTAILLPDASVMVAGSNSNPDVDINTFFPTEYRIEIFYPPYFSASVRPVPTGVPKTLSYGGPSFDITLPASSYTGKANDAADKTTVTIIRGGFTTHAMNMGQRHMQLRNTYTVNKDSSITLHVAQLPPNSNLFQPGPALLFVNVDGIPSNGTYVIIGSGKVETQPTDKDSVLPESVRLDTASGSGDNSLSDSNNTGNSSANGHKEESNKGKIIGGIVVGAAILLLLGVGALLFARRRRNATARSAPSSNFMGNAPAYSKQYVAMPPSGFGTGSDTASFSSTTKPPVGSAWDTQHNGESSVFIPLHKQSQDSDAWDPRMGSSVNLAGGTPYRDDVSGGNEVFGRQGGYGQQPQHPLAQQQQYGGYR